MSPYDFFHPETVKRISVDQFKATMLSNLIYTTQQYSVWIGSQSTSFPTVEECVDGYFPGINNFQQLLPVGRRRR
jgi:hypothetical protein